MAEENDLKEAAKGVVHQYAEKAVKPSLRFLATWRPIAAIIRDLSPESIAMVDQVGPGLGAIAVSKLPDSAFISPGAAAFVKNLILEASKSIGEVLRENREASENELSDAVDSAVARAESMLVTVDVLGHFHMPGCARMLNASSARRSKGHTGPLRNEIPFKDAVDQGLEPATCCYKRVEEAKTEAASTPKVTKGKRNLSPLDVIGSDAELGGQLVEWLQSLPPEQKPFVLERLEHLDTHEELVGFMVLPSDMRIEMLPFLESRHGKHAVKRWLGVLGGALQVGVSGIASAGTEMLEDLRRWDASFAEPAARVRAERRIPVAERVARNAARARDERARRQRNWPWYLRIFL